MAAVQQQSGRAYSIPAPYGGLNARDALANMPETDAITLDNFFPQPTWVELRNGRATLGTFTGVCETLAAYMGLTASQLYAAVNNAGTRSIYRVDNLGGGAVGAPVVGGGGGTIQTITNTRYDWLQFGTGAAEILYLLNGADSPLLYDGTTWQAVTTSSAPYALTGISNTNLLGIGAVYKQRIWFAQLGTFNIYYLPQNVFAGALTLLNIGPNFKLGGSLATIVTVSIDNASGLQDYIAFVSTVGEVVVFQGYDPANTATFFVSAHFRLGHPIGTGRRCWQKLGSDAAVICVDGVILLSQALLTDRAQTRAALSDKIRKAINFDVQSNGTKFGWQILLHPIGTKLLVNVPTTENAASYTYVMNTLNGSWCTFGKFNSPWNAYCWETMGDNLYFGTTGSVQQADTGSNDAGAAIIGQVKTAFSYFGLRGQVKRWTMARPIFTANGTVTAGLQLNVDFSNQSPGSPGPIAMGNQAIWNVSLWNITYWGDSIFVSKKWIGVGGVGYSAALQLSVQSLDVILQWQATDYIFEPGGLVW